jgi:hypothetical protein
LPTFIISLANLAEAIVVSEIVIVPKIGKTGVISLDLQENKSVRDTIRVYYDNL